MADDAVQEVTLRNEFYRDNYRRVIIALLLAVVLIALAVGALSFILVNPPEPKYFAVSSDGRLQPLVALSQPNLSQTALRQWANLAAVSAYTYSYTSYPQDLQAISEYFTPDGWSAFLDALLNSGTLDKVKKLKLIVSAVATATPVILDQGMLSGVYTWKVQIPLLVSFQSPNDTETKPVVVTMLITRVPSLNSAKGIGIAQFIEQQQTTSPNAT